MQVSWSIQMLHRGMYPYTHSYLHVELLTMLIRTKLQIIYSNLIDPKHAGRSTLTRSHGVLQMLHRDTVCTYTYIYYTQVRTQNFTNTRAISLEHIPYMHCTIFAIASAGTSFRTMCIKHVSLYIYALPIILLLCLIQQNV